MFIEKAAHRFIDRTSIPLRNIEISTGTDQFAVTGPSLGLKMSLHTDTGTYFSPYLTRHKENRVSGETTHLFLIAHAYYVCADLL